MTVFMDRIKSQWLREDEDLWTALKKLWAVVFLRLGEATFDASTFVFVLMCNFFQKPTTERVSLWATILWGQLTVIQLPFTAKHGLEAENKK